jgi:hypothetical protein
MIEKLHIARFAGCESSEFVLPADPQYLAERGRLASVGAKGRHYAAHFAPAPP